MATGTIQKVTNDSGTGYCKMQDGTLIQWGAFSVGPANANNSWGALYETTSIPVSETFSIPFYSTPHVAYRCRTNGAQVLLEDAMTVSTTGIAGAVQLYRPTAINNVSATITWIAIGRWK